MWAQNACEFTCQLYQDNEMTEITPPPMKMADGSVIPGVKQLVPTGQMVRRIRTAYHPNYAARGQAPVGAMPEYIEAHSPEDLWESLAAAMRGDKSRHGKYASVVK